MTAATLYTPNTPYSASTAELKRCFPLFVEDFFRDAQATYHLLHYIFYPTSSEQSLVIVKEKMNTYILPSEWMSIEDHVTHLEGVRTTVQENQFRSLRDVLQYNHQTMQQLIGYDTNTCEAACQRGC